MIEIVSESGMITSDRDFMVWMYMEFKDLMYATAYRYINTVEVAEDIVQDSIVSLIKKINTLQQMEKNALCAYIVATIRNASINYLKSRDYEHTHQSSYEEKVLYKIPSDISLDELIELSDHLDLLSKIWVQLSCDEQFLLEGKYILGYNDRELGGRLKCKPSSIRMKLTRARRNALSLLREIRG